MEPSTTKTQLHSQPKHSGQFHAGNTTEIGMLISPTIKTTDMFLIWINEGDGELRGITGQELLDFIMDYAGTCEKGAVMARMSIKVL